MMQCLEGNPRAYEGDGETTADDATEERPERVLRCAVCGTELASPKAIFRKGSDHLVQAHANPYGFIHEIVTVRAARNLLYAGPPTTEFTWFPGYAWETAYCAGCQSHVGWRYTATRDEVEPPRFWGLLRKMIRE